MIDQMREEMRNQYEFLVDLRGKIEKSFEVSCAVLDVNHDITERMFALNSLLTETKLVSDVSLQTKSSAEGNTD